MYSDSNTVINKNIALSSVIMAILFLGFYMTSTISSSSTAMAQKLDLSELPFVGNSELAEIGIQSLMEEDVQDILDKFMRLISFNGNNIGANPS